MSEPRKSEQLKNVVVQAGEIERHFKRHDKVTVEELQSYINDLQSALDSAKKEADKDASVYAEFQCYDSENPYNEYSFITITVCYTRRETDEEYATRVALEKERMELSIKKAQQKEQKSIVRMKKHYDTLAKKLREKGVLQ